MENKQEIARLLSILEQRKKFYGIKSAKLQPHQQELIDAIKEKTIIDEVKVPQYKYIMFQGGNGAGKSFIGLYTVSLLALGDLCYSYGLPYIGSRNNIRIVTKSGSNVQSTIGPYLTGDFSKTRIPPDAIEKIIQDNGILKSIILKNGNKINIRTYDQGYERLQGGNPDFILIDEEPVNEMVWNEILMRGRSKQTQIVITMTPLNGLTPVYSFFYEQNSEKVNHRIKKFLFASTQNKFADHTALEGLTEQDRQMRLYGMFVPPSGLVYSNFNRFDHTLPSVKLEDLGYGTKFYGAIDFGVVHPTAFLAIAVDNDGHIFIFDSIYQSGLLMSDIAKKIREIKSRHNIEFEYIVADTAAKRERTELAQLGIKTVPADKWSKGENGESNRKAGIMKVNQLLAQGKLFISTEVDGLIKEFETHHYKEGGKKDGEVEKTDDDLLRRSSLLDFYLQNTQY